MEVQLATAAGIVEVFAGSAGDNRWEIASTGVGHTATARPIVGERRLYAVVGDNLAYASELHVGGEFAGAGFAPHLSARLDRVRS